MRILLISGEFPPMQGGVGDYTREMARAFVALGHEASVLAHASLASAHARAGPSAADVLLSALRTGPSAADVLLSALRTGPSAADVLLSALRTGPQPWRVLPVVRDWKWGCWPQIAASLREVRPDVVDVQYQAAIYDMRVPAVNLLPWRLRRTRDAPPLAVTFHDLKPPYLFPKAGPLREWAVRMLARYSDAAILTNAQDYAAASVWPFFHPSGDPRRPTMHQIPISSNIAVAPPADFDRTAWRAGLGYRRDDFVWAYFGFLNESKGGETLIRALARSQPAAKLLMIGGRVGSSDPTNRAYAERVEALIHELGLSDRVQWTGYVSSEQVSAALLSADIVVLPYRDGISLRRGSLHAALVHGGAIVSTTPSLPLPELHEGENVLLVPPEDPKALGQAALRLHRDPALRRRIGEGAKALAEQFTWKRIAQRTVDEVFRPLLAAR